MARLHSLLTPAALVLTITIATSCGGETETAGIDYSSAQDPAWAPDGKRLAYVRVEIDDRSTFTVWVRDTSGGNDTKLVDSGVRPDWSPDGKRIAFTWQECDSACPRTGGIAVMNADGSDVRRILSTRPVHPLPVCFTATASDPAWSPDGRLIAYSDRSAPGIFVMRPDGSQRRRITYDDDLFPDWSPDGRHLVFLRATGWARHDVIVTAVDGTDRRVVASDSGGSVDFPDLCGGRAAWSPRGTTIAYGSTAIVLVDVAKGREPTFLRRCDEGEVVTGGCWDPAWSPDGGRIAYSRERVDAPQTIEIIRAPG